MMQREVTVTVMFIYIPLCLYFNDSANGRHEKESGIYIPLCLYFNPYSNVPANVSCIFTFHYVSILIAEMKNLTAQHSHLHSIMSLF